MKAWLMLLATAALLSGCSASTPECADSETLEILDFAIYEEVERYTKNRNIEGFAEIADTYEIDQIRMLNYDEVVDSYSCSARITYDYEGRIRRVDFSYQVDTNQGSGDAIVEYENKMLYPITGYLMGL